MATNQPNYALFFGNRGFFPATMIAQARADLSHQLQNSGHNVLLMDESTTRFGAVETPVKVKNTRISYARTAASIMGV